MKTRDRILHVSRELFYEKGFIGTYYDEIAKLSSMSPGTLYYYFKSKNVLAGELLDTFNSNLLRDVSEIYGTENDSFCSTLFCESVIYYRLINENPNFKRFYLELCKSGIINSYTFDTTEKLTDTFLSFAKRNMNPYESQMSAICINSVQSGLMSSYYDGRLDTSFEQTLKYCLRVLYFLLGENLDGFERYFEKILKTVDKRRFHMESGFRVVFE